MNDQADPQQAVIAFLSRPATYGLHDGEVERIETHCSIVFLAGDRAYKLKRAIRFASLDYTSNESRQAACEAELRLNRRTAPEIYLCVRAISRDRSGALVFDGSGPPLDHVVVMRRFAQSDLFESLAETAGLTPEMMAALGESIAQFHAAAEPAPAFGGSGAIRRVIADNDRELALVAPTLDGAAVGSLSHRTEMALADVAELLDQRRTQGSVRRCHGDLRLANICLYENRPTLFDCIEFSEEIGCIDALYDLAFLLMDLHVRGRGDLCNAVFNAYLDHARETEGLQALPLFLSLRAATRSYALAGAAGRRADAQQAARLIALARRHIEAANAFLVREPPALVLLGGDNIRRRSETAARLATLMSPPQGARILRLGSSDEATWRHVSAVLAAGCSVLLEGAFTGHDTQNAIVALPPAVRLLPLWLGPPRAGSNEPIWQTLDDGKGILPAIARAQTLLAAASAAAAPLDQRAN